MREVRIPKRNGTYRTVVVPSRSVRKRLAAKLPALNAVAMLLDVHGVAHGFVPGRSPITCALVHRGFRYSLCMDLEDCFGHITQQLVYKAISGIDCLPISECYYHGVAAQGLPTSPALCNIALSPMDAEIVSNLEGHDCVYTRYADDLTVSSDDRYEIDRALGIIQCAAHRHGQVVAHKKTKIQDARAGRRIIVGVAVDDDIQPTRATKRKLRAAKHQRQHNHATGLAEWCKLKKPNVARTIKRYMAIPSLWHQSCAIVMAQRAEVPPNLEGDSYLASQS